MRLKNYVFVLLLSFTCSTIAWGQTDGKALLFNMDYAAANPTGDLSDRFGFHSEVGIGVDLLTAKSGWIIGLTGNIMYGTNVKEDVLATLRTDSGFIIGNDRDPASIQLRERGWYLGGHLGKIFSFTDNKKSGIRITVGSGLLQHKIRIQDDPERPVAALSGDYKAGYDRLTNGIAFREFIGYQYLSTNQRINFRVGVELTQGFTQNRRNFNFDTREVDDRNRTDIILGFKLGWTLPFYLDATQQEIFY
ncbi:MAG: hypothetical protein AB8G22_00560 [Saprospiraceae bacterium]